MFNNSGGSSFNYDDIYLIAYLALTFLTAIIYFLIEYRGKGIVDKIINETPEGEKLPIDQLKKVVDCISIRIACCGILCFWGAPVPLLVIFGLVGDKGGDKSKLSNLAVHLSEMILGGGFILSYFMAVFALVILWARMEPMVATSIVRTGKKLSEKVLDISD